MQQVGWNMATYMGMRASQEFELLSHNMANASTPGFKAELLHLWRLEVADGPTDSLGQTPASFLNVRSRDYTQGSLHATGNDTDFALDGSGFFKVETPQGIRYTRNGQFRLTNDRQLATKEGYLVQGKSGPITLNAIDQNFYMDPEGGVHLDKSLGDQIAVADFPNLQGLAQQGQCLFAATRESGSEIEALATKVRQGEIEESNFDPTAEIVQLINIQRSFEAYLKVLDTFTAKDRKVIEEIGTPA
ncbi:MAG: flagellar hook basal-body protein [Deltaproteobacteria bacterium]|nr:flagellar hook basal-body protein [Deltaproteobacteria bacterium]